MSAEWVLGFSVPSLLVASTFAGDLAARHGRRPATWFMVAMILPLIVKALGPEFRELQIAWFGTGLYPILRPWWGFPFAFGLLACAAGTRERRSEKNGLRLLLVGLGLLVCQRVHATVTADPGSLRGRLDESGICWQSSDHSCGAAAAVMLLDQHGIERSEAEMAEACSTNALTGTDVFCVLRGLSQVLREEGAPLTAHYTEPRFEELGLPAMVPIEHSFLVDHWVVVRTVDPVTSAVELYDPSKGRVVWSQARFRDRWIGEAVELKPAR